MTARLLYFVLCVFTCLFQVSVYALEFKTEREKGLWIKDFFKDKTVEMNYPDNATKKLKSFKRKLIHDFMTQNGIENIEPIASGSSILDPEIAKYNTACPDKKPIDLYKEAISAFDDRYYSLEEQDEFLEKIDGPSIQIKRCHGDIKIYKLGIDYEGEKEQYILYCSDHRYVRLSGTWRDINREIESGSIVGSYLQFKPNKCIYSQELFNHQSALPNAVSGIMRYKGRYYFYRFDTVSWDKEKYLGSIWIRKVFLDKERKYNFFSADINKETKNIKKIKGVKK